MNKNESASDERRTGTDRRGTWERGAFAAELLGKPRMLLGADRWIREEIAREVSQEAYSAMNWDRLPKWFRPPVHPSVVYHWLHFAVFAVFPHALTFISVYLLTMKVITPFMFGLIGVGYVVSVTALVIVAHIHTSRAQRAAIEKVMHAHPGYGNFLRAYASMRDPFDDADGKGE